MAVGLPGAAKLEASIFYTVFKVRKKSSIASGLHSDSSTFFLQSISILGSYVGNRQDAKEALDIAARGGVKVHFVLKKLSDIETYALFSTRSLPCY